MTAQAERIARQTEMLNLLEGYQKSGKSQSQFCKDKKLSKATFLYWLKKYRKEIEQTTGFIPLNIPRPDSAADYRIELPNGGVEGFRAEVLAERTAEKNSASSDEQAGRTVACPDQSGGVLPPKY